MDNWNRRFGQSQVSDREGGRNPMRFSETQTLKCKHCGNVSQSPPGGEGANALRCKHCGLILKVSETRDIGNQQKYMGRSK